MKKRSAKFLAIWLVLCFVMAAFPSALLANGEDPVADLEPGEIRLSKAATPTEEEGRWRVRLTLVGKNVETEGETTDIVLVVDRSGSMKDKMTNTKAAATAFVEGLLEEGNGISIALVSFADDVVDEGPGFQAGPTGAALLSGKINALSASGGTYTQHAIHKAKELLAGSVADHKAIVLVSDGQPTRSYDLTNTSDLSLFTIVGSKYYSRDDLEAGDFKTAVRVGGGSSLTTWIGWWPERYYHHGNSAIAEAAMGKPGITFYCIGIDLASEGTGILQSIATSPAHYYAAASEDLLDSFQTIAGQIANAATGAVVTDPIGDKFEYVPDLETNRGSAAYDNDTRTITWNVGNITEDEAYLEYVVEMLPEWRTGEDWPTNGDTLLDYTDAWGEEQSDQFEVPEVNMGPEEPEYGQITIFKALEEELSDPYDGDPVFRICLAPESYFDSTNPQPAAVAPWPKCVELGIGGHVVYNELEPGSYRVWEDEESLPLGWSCVNPLINVVVEAGGSHTVTVKNYYDNPEEPPVETATLTVYKELSEVSDPYSGSQKFRICIEKVEGEFATSAINPWPKCVELGIGQSYTFEGLEPGLYKVYETNIPANWTCDNPENHEWVTVGEGSSCTIYNSYKRPTEQPTQTSTLTVYYKVWGTGTQLHAPTIHSSVAGFSETVSAYSFEGYDLREGTPSSYTHTFTESDATYTFWYEEILPEEELPEELPPLAGTGGVEATIMYGMGVSLLGLGLALSSKRRRK